MRAQAGIHYYKAIDSCLHGNDKFINVILNSSYYTSISLGHQCGLSL